MPHRHRTTAIALAGTLALLCACADRGTGDHPHPETTPVTARVPFEVDPAHRNAEVVYAAAFAYDQAVARPQSDDEEPKRKIPAARKKKAPAVLDLTCTTETLTVDALPIAQVATVRVYDDQQRQLAAFTVADDCDYSIERKFDFAHDLGPIHRTIGHLRMAAPPALDAHLRETPGATVTIVGLDAQGRIMLVQQADGYLDAETGVAKGVRVGKSVVWLWQHRDYEPDRERALSWSYTSAFLNDEPVAIPPETFLGEEPPKTKKAPAKWLAKSPLVLDLIGDTPIYRREPPLAKVVAIYVFGPQCRLLATRTVGKDCWYTCTTRRLSEGESSTPYALEHLRTELDPASFVGLHEGNDHLLWVIAVDAEGKTVVADLRGAPIVGDAPAQPASLPSRPPPRSALGHDPDDPAPTSVGVATMDEDGTLNLHLRSQEADGTIAEALLVVTKTDKRYPGMLEHLGGGLKPGGSCSIPPFPEPAVDPDSVAP